MPGFSRFYKTFPFYKDFSIISINFPLSSLSPTNPAPRRATDQASTGKRRNLSLSL
jgi:hypothetical protein